MLLVFGVVPIELWLCFTLFLCIERVPKPDVSKIGEIHIYADHITAFVTSKTVDEAILSLKMITKNVEIWCSTNKLTINKGRTECKIINSKSFNGTMNQVIMNGKSIR